MEPFTILCIDDDHTVLTALRNLLGKHVVGATVEIAESGKEALEIAQELAEQTIPLKVVIADYIMPGMKGDETLVNLHGTDPNAIKIMLTGQSDLSGVKRAINEAKLYRFLEKPFNNADLVMTVNNAVKAYNAEAILANEYTQLKLKISTLEEELKKLKADS